MDETLWSLGSSQWVNASRKRKQVCVGALPGWGPGLSKAPPSRPSVPPAGRWSFWGASGPMGISQGPFHQHDPHGHPSKVSPGKTSVHPHEPREACVGLLSLDWIFPFQAKHETDEHKRPHPS